VAQAAARALTKRAPAFADWVMGRLTPDVDAYLTLLHVRQAVNSAVAAYLDQPAVVVGHSLGSIVAYWVLTEGGVETSVPLLVTLGSPLGIETVKKRLPRPLGKPAGVKHWFNAADMRDDVALLSRLDRDTFPAEIENLSDVHNPKHDAHGISGYLADGVVAQRISEALRRTGRWVT
jgi:pimeloyl-ACP methyl ester carboxylesterase